MDAEKFPFDKLGDFKGKICERNWSNGRMELLIRTIDHLLKIPMTQLWGESYFKFDDQMVFFNIKHSKDHLRHTRIVITEFKMGFWNCFMVDSLEYHQKHNQMSAPELLDLYLDTILTGKFTKTLWYNSKGKGILCKYGFDDNRLKARYYSNLWIRLLKSIGLMRIFRKEVYRYISFY